MTININPDGTVKVPTDDAEYLASLL